MKYFIVAELSKEELEILDKEIQNGHATKRREAIHLAVALLAKSQSEIGDEVDKA